jgi:glycosyltransferase involved in cell wall biosynthesis
MNARVMQLLVALRMGGAERLALSILRQGREHFSGLVAGLFYAPGNLQEAADTLGIPWLALRAETGGRPRAIWRLYKEIKRHQVTLLHAQAAYLLPYALPAAKMAGIPVVYTEHALHSLQTISWLRLAVRLSAPFLRGIACVNKEVALYFQKELGIRPSQLRIIANGVDVERFSPAAPAAPLPWDGPSDEPCFVFGAVSRLCEAKDHPSLLHAFSLVAKRHPQARLLLVGDGEERPRTEALIQKLGLGDKSHITGMCHNIPERLRSMDVFVLSSKREGLPMALLEAMACGLPVISTAVGGIPDLNTGNERLMLTPAERPEALAQAMESLMTDHRKRRSLAESGREYILAARTDRGMADAYRQMYMKAWLSG